jgi:hypothetical protein
MSQKQKTPNLLQSLTWEEFKLQFNERFTQHHLVCKDVDGAHSLECYVQNFIRMLPMVPLKEEFAQKLVFLRGLKPWV